MIDKKCFYKNIKKSLENEGFVLTSRNALIDFMVLNVKKDIEIYKISPIWDEYRTELYTSKLKKWYKYAWYKANYTIIYFDKNYIEVKRETFPLN